MLPRAKVTYEDQCVHRAHADPTSGFRAAEAEGHASHVRSRTRCIRILHRPSGVAPFIRCSTHPHSGTSAFNLAAAPGLASTRRVPHGTSSLSPIGLLRSLIYPYGPLILLRRFQAAGRQPRVPRSAHSAYRGGRRRVADGTRTRDLPSYNPTTSIATGCLKLQNRLF
jgi:hypothetical protein